MMQIKNRKDIKPIEDACEALQELHHSKNLSISYATIHDKTRPHKHLKMEEVYYIVKGAGKMEMGNDVFEIKSGDIISIPKNVYHCINFVNSPIELVVVTYPRFDTTDLLY